MSPNPGILQGHTMDDAAIDRVLEANGVGVLSMALGGTPYSIPMSFGYAGDETLYFLLAGHSEDGKKMEFAEESEEASFLVYDVAADDEWKSVIVSGALARITPEEWDTAREAMIDNAYRPDLLTSIDVQSDPRVWSLDIETKSGRAMGTE
ncbi:pyridoxamine 5'-phosphate oxidase family protein [Natranaeroarchaeum aerophilus]|uniref:Pyridoxamine 5'-phosphate oxidase family protein n=1 Tax=Natranaeroarchaeum aerophilus TaxID=2917711 RepID=A0AAE3FNR9_9EURY|nr:pyridoxamine 5'-phosphate oxidase family protein [Natranaeroarchaeum aerophilus]MCL9812484.1 pyridoxamine 5'-phosphate oxidase family protein [Natranaeroarchaeum aerophilus]